MKTYKRLLQIGLSLMLFILVMGIGFTLWFQLKEPVFFRYCTEIPVEIPVMPQELASGQALYSLQYITNRNDDRRVREVILQGEEEFKFFASELLSGGFASFFMGRVVRKTGDEILALFNCVLFT